jgi:phage terminase Nu1 subunit (DNA packaging protein)
LWGVEGKLPTLMTRREFAEHMAVDVSRTSQWKRDGRLVLVDGKIDCEASEAAINASGTRQRYLTKRTAAAQPQDALREARTRTETARADQAELEARKRAGQLVEVVEARRAIAALAEVVGKALDALPARVGATLAARYGAPAGDALTILRTEITTMRKQVLADAATALTVPKK